MSLINQTAREILESGKAAVIIGYSEGTINGKTQPQLAYTSEQTEKFIFNKECINNLTVYLNKSYKLPRPVGIFVKPCDRKTINSLIQEKQINREDVFIIGVSCEGVYVDQSLSGKCRHCASHNPVDCDITIGEQVNEPVQQNTNKFARLDEVEKLSAEEKWNFWQKEFDKCIRCYACRQVCPLCYCEQCIVDKTQPRWIDSSAHPVGNFSWHLIRTFHLAGRCIGCGECERACHQNIPLGLLNMKMGKAIFDEYGYVPGVNTDAKPPLTVYRMEDNQDFIR